MAYLSCCWICGTTVQLEDCKIDERGLPVHEACYVAKLIGKTTMRSTDTPPPPESVS